MTLSVDQEAPRPLVEPRAPMWAQVVGRPVRSAFVFALAVRLIVAVVSFVLNARYLIPDEIEYITLARHVASGHTADSWQPFYGQRLYHSTWTFMAPLVQLVKVFGGSRLVAQLYVVVTGSLGVALAARLARAVVSDAWALAAGMVLAVLPSQVLFSSVVLREAHVWLCLGLVIAGAFTMASSDRQHVLLGALVSGIGLLGLGFLRQQTLVATTWALLAAMLILRRQAIATRVASTVALAVLVPWVAGIGPGGWTLIERSVPALGRTRTVLAVGAETGYAATTIVPRPPSSTTTPASGSLPPSRSPQPSTPPSTTTTAAPIGAATINGRSYLIDERLGANLASIPRGLVANTVRPFPWESGHSLSFLLARLENLVWYALYVLAAVGFAVAAKRQHQRRLLLFPLILLAGILVIAALTQGNLGTAFRHRQQVGLPIVLFAVVGADRLWSRRVEGRRLRGPAVQMKG